MERREWKRVGVTISGKGRPADESGYETVRIADIHHHGCRIQSPVEFARGQEIRIVADIPVEGALYMAGTVRWCRRDPSGRFFTMGVLFIVDSPEAVQNQQKLYSYCTQQG